MNKIKRMGLLKKPEIETRVLAYRVTVKEYDDFKKVCDNKGVRISTLLSWIVGDYLKKIKDE